METAIQVVIQGEMVYSKAVTTFDVPFSTLERYVKKRIENKNSLVDITAGKYRTVFTTK